MKTFNSRKDLYTFPQVEEIFGISRITIHRWIKAGHFPPPLVFNKFTPNATKYWEKKLIDGYYRDHQPQDVFRAKYLTEEEIGGDPQIILRCRELEKENQKLKSILDRVRKALSNSI